MHLRRECCIPQWVDLVFRNVYNRTLKINYYSEQRT